jgi:hypothetical protein
MPAISLQPKQWELLDLIEHDPASWIGVGGGRGAAKSGGIDRTALSLMIGQPGIVCALIMRTSAQVRKYHIEPMLRAWPDLVDYYAWQKGKLKLPTGDKVFSELDIGYAENYDAVENFFRSGNYKYVFVDQAEQFTEMELREIKKACRWPGGGAKMILSFNMGGNCIQFLKRIFKDCEYNERDDAANYAFLKVNPWDNVFWVIDALKADGLTERDYYSWTDEQRMVYAADRGEYTKQLNADDDAIRARDWLGSWESLEGAYFGRVFDRQALMVDPLTASRIIKSWDQRWMSGDWGKAHYSAIYWHSRTKMAPSDVKSVFGWEVTKPVNIVLTYRELLVNETGSGDLGKLIVLKTPQAEREQTKRFFFSPDAFGERDSDNTIADKIDRELRPFGLPMTERADNTRSSGAMLMYDLMQETKRMVAGVWQGGDIWLISSECPELLSALPVLMRDPKDLNDVLKTDKGMAKIEQDAYDAARYGLQSMLGTKATPKSVVLDETLAAASSPQMRLKTLLTFDEKWKQTHQSIQRQRRYR